MDRATLVLNKKFFIQPPAQENSSFACRDLRFE